jgi:hypothetical protein
VLTTYSNVDGWLVDFTTDDQPIVRPSNNRRFQKTTSSIVTVVKISQKTASALLSYKMRTVSQYTCTRRDIVGRDTMRWLPTVACSEGVTPLLTLQETTSFAIEVATTQTHHNRPRPAKLVPNFVGRGYCMVSATDPYGYATLLFHSSSSSIILTRLSGPRSRPTASQNIW